MGDQNYLQLTNPSRIDPIEYIHRHPNFRLFATQNPNCGLFKGKREIHSTALLSRFEKITFNDLTKKECETILVKLCEKQNLNISSKTIAAMINFHFQFQE